MKSQDSYGDFCIHDLLVRHAKQNPDTISILAAERIPLTYGRLLDQVTRCAKNLRSLGVERADRVAIVLPNGPEMAVAFLAVAACATSAPLNPAYRAKEFDFYLSDLNARAVIVQAGIDSPAREAAKKRGMLVLELSPETDAEAGVFSLVGQANSLPETVDFTAPEDTALVLHTSGTTSRPKIVPLTNRNICSSASNIRTFLKLTPDDRCLNVMPLFHIHGLIGALLATVAAGGSIVCPPGYLASRFFQWMDAFLPTWYTAVPTIHQSILSRASEHQNTIDECGLRFLRSSSASLPARVRAELESTFRVPVIEAYGMTEAAHQMASNPLPPDTRKTGSVGLSAGPAIAIMDEKGLLLPVGKTGEVVIHGSNVMNGYENNPEANRNAFTNGWFRTGDQGFIDQDGYLFLTGRLKEIINRGGEKISPREVDEILMEHPDIEQVVTFAIPHPKLGEDVGAAVVPRDSVQLSPREIREFAAARLADFKVPRRVVILEKIPKGPTGKLQRIGLAEKLGMTTAEDEQTADVPYIAPRNPTEEKLATIWADVLGLERVGVHDEFLYLGGDSVLATLLITRIRRAFHVDLSLLAFFEDASTVERMSHWLASAQKDAGPESIPLQQISRDQELPLSFSQERQWFIQQVDPENCAYNSHVAFRFSGILDLAALEKSLNETVRRHEVLRTRLISKQGYVLQEITNAATVEFQFIDLSSLPEQKKEASATAHMVERARQPFELAKDLMIRPLLLRLNETEHLLLIVIHHVAFDGWSSGVFSRELMELYAAFSEGKPSPLPELQIQYADFAKWQRDNMERGCFEGQLRYWEGKLSGRLPVLELPTDYHRPPRQSYQGNLLFFKMDEELSRLIKALCKKKNTTLYMFLLAAFQCLLHRYSGQTDIIVGSPISGRTHLETEDLIGMFINTLPLRTDLSGNPPFIELLSRIRRTALEAYENQDVPFQKVVEVLKPERSRSYLPLFQVMFALQNAPMPELKLPALEVHQVDLDKKASIADLSLHVWDKPEGLSGWFIYDTALFRKQTAERMLDHFQILLKSIVEHPEHRISELQILDETERNQLLIGWNDTKTNYPRNSTIPELFEAQVERTPDAVALSFGSETITYFELNKRTNRLAHFLLSCGVGPGSIVGVCMERSIEMVAAFLGTLKAGGAYLPLDPAYPVERLTLMMDDADAPILLTQKDLAGSLPETKCRIVNLDSDWTTIQQEKSGNPANRVLASDPAYVMYTSGSTGRPKGVIVPHRAVVRLVLNTDYIQFGPADRVAQVSNCAFDAATFEIWGALLNGGCLVGISRDVSLSPKRFCAALRENGITTLFLTPALFNHIAQEIPHGFKSLKNLLLGGDAVDPVRVRQVLENGPPARLLNAYGPTENTTFSICYLMTSVPDGAKTVPIGRPISNTQAYVLDANLQPVPVGIPGELYLAGDGLALGYLNRPDLSREKFISNPFSDKPDDLLYKTGDLVRYLPDGNIDFIGRIDNQVKIRGFRIEPEEVEIALAQFRGVRETVVMAREDEPGDRRLVGYVVLEKSLEATVMDMRNFLKRKMPEYMVPSAIVIMGRFPLTPNGKIDRASLPAPDPAHCEIEREFVAPTDPLELRLAKLWENLLDVHPIGLTDNFFDLGGHSLLVARLFSQVEKMTGKTLPLSVLIENPTVQELAGVLRKEGWAPKWQALVLIQPLGNRNPLFCIHPQSGNILGYTDLARYLGRDQPIYGLQALGTDGKQEPLETVEKMAELYLNEVKTIAPEGPYFLCGRCSIGGSVAFEMAQQLVQQGETVGLLALVDVGNPPRLLYPGKKPDRHESFLRYPRRNFLRIISRLIDSPQKRRFKRVLDANNKAKNAYLPTVYPGRIIYFFSEEYSRKKSLRFRLDVPGGWKELAGGGFEIHMVPGGHRTMLSEPYVEEFAQKMKSCIQKATENASNLQERPPVGTAFADTVA